MRPKNPGSLRAATAFAGLLLLIAVPAAADETQDALLAACRANPELAEVPSAAALGCTCAVDAMAELSAAQMQAIAQAGFTPDSFNAVADDHPGLLAAVRDCLAPPMD